MQKSPEHKKEYEAVEKQAARHPPEQPDSRIAYDAVRKAAEGNLSPAEFRRIEANVRRIDYSIDLIRRDRRIKRDIAHALRKGEMLHEAIEGIATQYHISPEHIRTVWYGKKHKEKGSREDASASEMD